MNIVSIAELAASDVEENTDYVTYGSSLTGEIEFIENTPDPTSDYECFMLIDPDTFTGMKCRLTIFDRSVLGMHITVNRWYVRYLKEPLLDICVLETVAAAANPNAIGDLMIQARTARARSMIESELTFQALPYIEGTQDRFDIFSIIATKSAVFLDQSQQPYFIVHIASDDLTACVVFRGKNMRMYYQEIAVERWYAFTNLKIAASSNSDQHVFLFDGETSDFCQLIDEQVATLYEKFSSIAMSMRPNPPAVIIQPWERSKGESSHLIQCSGIITEVIDPVLGLYIIDHNLPVCLAQCPTYFPISGYWEGSAVNIRHAHMVMIHTNQFGSTLLDTYFHCPSQSDLEHERYWRVLFGCAHTEISVEQLPEAAGRNCQSNPSMLRAFISKNAFNQKYGFATMITWQEAFWSLKRKVRDADTYHESLVSQTNTLIKSLALDGNEDSPRNLVEEFMFYNACSVFRHADLSEDHMPSMNLPNYPSLSQLANISCIPNLQQLQLSSSVNDDNPLANIPLQAWSYSLSDTAPNSCVLVGYISGGSDGRLYFADNTGRIPIILMGEMEYEFSSEALCMIKSCSIVEEDLSYISDSGERIESQCRYLVVKYSSIVNLQPSKVQITFCTAIPSNVEQGRIFAYDQAPNLPFTSDDRLKVFYVRHLPTSNLCINELGKQYLSCAAEVVLFDLINSISIAMSTLRPKAQQCTLILTSHSQSLALLPIVKPEYWYVMVNAIEGEPSSQPLLYLDKNSAIYPIISNGGNYKLRQFTQDIQSAPISASTVASQDLNVNDLVNINFTDSDPDEPLILSNNFYRHLVSFEAFVITKNFTESNLSGVEPDKFAQLYYDNLAIGTGRTNRWLFLKLRSINSQDTIDVYFNVGKKIYPIGLVSGCRIKIHKIALKVSENTRLVYGVMLPCSGIEIMDIPTDHQMPDDIGEVIDVETRILSDFLRDPSNKAYQALCYVKSIQQISLSWLCLECGQMVINDNCYGMCIKARRIFVAQAVATMTDGTADITVSIEGEDMVMTLLRLSDKQAGRLKEATYMHGEMIYSNWFAKEDATIRDAGGISSGANLTSRGRTLHSMCSNPAIFTCVSLQARRVARRGDHDKDSLQINLFRKIHVLPVKLVSNDPEAALQSLVHARVRLHVLRIKPIDVIEQANALL